MNVGLIDRSVGRSVVWSSIIGPAHANNPVTNLSDLDQITKIWRTAEGGGHVVGGVLPAPASVDAMALIGHNLPVGSVMRLLAFSGPDNDPVADAADIVYDSGEILVWPTGGPAEGFRSIRPLLFPAAVMAQSFYLSMSPPVAIQLEMGGVDFGRVWKLPGISFGREMGLLERGGGIDLAGGGSLPGEHVDARILNAQVDFMRIAETATRGLDMQKGLGIHVPFVFAHDLLDASTWARQALYVRNKDLPNMVGALYRHDAFPIRLVEHTR